MGYNVGHGAKQKWVHYYAVYVNYKKINMAKITNQKSSVNNSTFSQP